MPGDYDALLKWPFRQSVTFKVINQRRPGDGDIVQTFDPDGSTMAFRKPTARSNPASGCTHFGAVRQFEVGSDFVLNDTLFVKCTVDTAGLD